METQKIINLFNDTDNESLKLATKKWYVINDQNVVDYGKGNENGTSKNMRIKTLHQIFVIIQMHIFM